MVYHLPWRKCVIPQYTQNPSQIPQIKESLKGHQNWKLIVALSLWLPWHTCIYKHIHTYILLSLLTPSSLLLQASLISVSLFLLNTWASASWSQISGFCLTSTWAFHIYNSCPSVFQCISRTRTGGGQIICVNTHSTYLWVCPCSSQETKGQQYIPTMRAPALNLLSPYLFTTKERPTCSSEK